MIVLYRSFWSWGGKPSESRFDLNVPGSRIDLRNLIARIKAGKESEEVVHHELLEVKEVSMDTVLKVMDEYPTPDRE